MPEDGEKKLQYRSNVVYVDFGGFKARKDKPYDTNSIIYMGDPCGDLFGGDLTIQPMNVEDLKEHYDSNIKNQDNFAVRVMDIVEIYKSFHEYILSHLHSDYEDMKKELSEAYRFLRDAILKDVIKLLNNKKNFGDDGYLSWLEYFVDDFAYSYRMFLEELNQINGVENILKSLLFLYAFSSYVLILERLDKTRVDGFIEGKEDLIKLWDSYLSEKEKVILNNKVMSSIYDAFNNFLNTFDSRR